MGIAGKIAGFVTKTVTKAAKGKIKPKVLIDGQLFPFGKGSRLAAGKKVEFQVKPDISMPIAPATLNKTKPALPIRKNALTDMIDDTAKSELGNVAVRLARTYKGAVKAAKKEITSIFEGLGEIKVRSKGANSVYSKLEKKVVKNNKVIGTDVDASKLICDGIGGRVLMPNLTNADIIDTLRNVKIGTKKLTIREQAVMERFFRGEKLNSEELKIAKEYARPIKLALAERQSNPVVRQMTLSSLKAALVDGTTTMTKLEKDPLIAPDIIHELKTNADITPLRITELENYTGKNGIPYFTDKQINKLRDIHIASGRPIRITSVSEEKRFGKVLTPSEQDAIKKSGYTTAQFNVVLKDGTSAEIQIRGKGPFGDVEHIAYDATQDKNTLSHVFDDYQVKVKALGKDSDDAAAYCRYRNECYDYYRDLELGIVSPKPKLPANLDKILSEDSMIKLHKLDDKIQTKKMETFIPHIKLVA